MKEELQGKLVEILTSIQSAAGKASDFALTQLPDVAQSYVMYGRVWTLLELGVAVTALAALIYGTARYIRWLKSDDGDAEGVAAMAILCPVLGFGLITWTLVAAKSAAFVWFAPKVWLLKEIAGLLK